MPIKTIIAKAFFNGASVLSPFVIPDMPTAPAVGNRIALQKLALNSNGEPELSLRNYLSDYHCLVLGVGWNYDSSGYVLELIIELRKKSDPRNGLHKN